MKCAPSPSLVTAGCSRMFNPPQPQAGGALEPWRLLSSLPRLSHCTWPLSMRSTNFTKETEMLAWFLWGGITTFIVPGCKETGLLVNKLTQREHNRIIHYSDLAPVKKGFKKISAILGLTTKIFYIKIWEIHYQLQQFTRWCPQRV